MAVVVFDSDVLIGFLNADDARHEDAIAWVERAMTPGTRRMVTAVNYSEILIGPIRAGSSEIVDEMLSRFGIETMELATFDRAVLSANAALHPRP